MGKTPGKRHTSSNLARTWKRMGTTRRVEAVAATVMALVLVVALVIVFLRFVSYRELVGRTREHQNEMARQYEFNPGRIITDQRFHDTTSMNAEDVQVFLDQKGADCTGDSCLRTMRVDTPSPDGDGLCDPYQGGKGQTAAQIIDGAARSCGISQKVLLTMLQKEQHLVTSKNPDPTQIRSAMGLSCPDDAACDARYAGFFNQVYGAAKRYRYYETHRSDYQFQTRAINQVRFSPEASCGASDVYIENDATALLYIYTPYQPNTAALAAGDGEGDSCSSYGNRNFVIIYDAWFGRADE